MYKTFEEAKKHDYKYWGDKPVMKLNEKSINSTIIKKEINELSTDSINEYEWEKVDLGDEERMQEVANFITENYERGNESSYIVVYDAERLRWEMNNVGYFLTLKDKKIIGLIGFTYRTVQVYSDIHTMTEPVYMCCAKENRHKGVARKLMDKVINESLKMGVNKGIFCDNIIVPKPVATIRQYSRPLNYKKLRANDFVEICGVDENSIHEKMRINLRPDNRYIVAEKTEENINLVYKFYNEYMETFCLHAVLSKNEISNLLFDSRYVKTIFALDKDKKPVDFITYMHYDIINPDNKESNNKIKAANILMYSSNKIRVDLLFINVLKHISQDGIYIVYINDMMHTNDMILSNVKNADEDTDDEEQNATYDNCVIKTGKKTFINLYNWKCKTMRQDMVSWFIF